jgi:RimJ/RimL family protein N-acetyltransferase
MTVLETERLILRPLRDDDLDALAEMDADPEVMRYIADGSVRDRDEVAAKLRVMTAHWETHGFGLFALERRDEGDLLGWAGLAVPEFLPEVLPAVEIGWRLRRRCWGHGYATEAATEAMRFGFDTCGLDRLISIRHVDNTRSARVMEKLGLAYEFETVVPATRQQVAIHAITAGSYRRQDRGGSEA